MLQKIRFFGSIGALYLLTIGTIGGILYSSHLFGTPAWATSQPTVVIPKAQPTPLPPKVISGKPVQITLPTAAIDLKIDDGLYNDVDGSWALSDTNAQFATMSAPSNDHAGTTFIYGHGTDAVFGKIGSNHPPAGSLAQIQTDNGHMFTYELQEVRNFEPSDTSIFSDMTSGSPRLIVQTCTGVFSEWRTMFIFTLKEVS
jgi:hypothetical protein